MTELGLIYTGGDHDDTSKETIMVNANVDRINDTADCQ